MRMRLPIVLVASVLVSACVVTETPVVQACRTTRDSGPAPSMGEFTILPSLVPGVEITHASWQVRGEKDDGPPVENLYLSATLRATRTVPQEEIAVVYDTPGSHAIIDDALLQENVESYNLDSARPFLVADSEKTAWYGKQIQASYRIGPNSALSYCPRTVRVVPRSALALALSPELETPQGQAARLRSAGTHSPLTVIMDSVVQDRSGLGLVVGAALNTTDSTLRDMVVGLVVVSDSVAGNDADSTRHADTLEYRVGDVAPHSLAPFSGGSMRFREGVTARVAYHATDVRGREVALSGQRPRHAQRVVR